MKLKKEFEMTVPVGSNTDPIRVDSDRYISANDMAAKFPGRELKEWRKNKSTEESISYLKRDLNRGNSPQLKDDQTIKIIEPIKTKRGKYGSGTWLHPDLAFEFAMWLSVEFKYHVIRAYQQSLRENEDWGIKRVLVAQGCRLLTDAVKSEIVDKTGNSYAYPIEMNILNRVVFGKNADGENLRDYATLDQLNALKTLENVDVGLIKAGLSEEMREKTLMSVYSDFMKNSSSKVRTLMSGE